MQELIRSPYGMQVSLRSSAFLGTLSRQEAQSGRNTVPHSALPARTKHSSMWEDSHDQPLK